MSEKPDKTNSPEQSCQPKTSALNSSDNLPKVDPSKTIEMIRANDSKSNNNESLPQVDPEKTIPYLQTGAIHQRKKRKKTP